MPSSYSLLASLCRWLLLGLVCLSTLPSLLAQGYDAAAGLRVGAGAGLTYAQRFGSKYSVEFLGQNRFGTDAFTLAVIGRRHVPLALKRVNFFVGAGFHKGWGYEKEGRRGNPLGITAQGGAEITLGRTNVAFDFLPQVHLSGRVVPVSISSAVSVRYVIVKRKTNLSIRRPWESKEEMQDRENARDKRRKARAKAKRKGETPTLRERLGIPNKSDSRD